MLAFFVTRHRGPGSGADFHAGIRRLLSVDHVRNIVRKRHDGGPIEPIENGSNGSQSPPEGRHSIFLPIRGDESGPHHLPARFCNRPRVPRDLGLFDPKMYRSRDARDRVVKGSSSFPGLSENICKTRGLFGSKNSQIDKGCWMVS